MTYILTVNDDIISDKMLTHANTVTVIVRITRSIKFFVATVLPSLLRTCSGDTPLVL